MDISTLILAVIAIVAALGSIAAFFTRNRGMKTIELLQMNIDAYKDSEKLKEQRIAYLEGQLFIKDETIKRLLNDGKQSPAKE